MAKPIGNLTANMKTNDKVGYRTRARFASQSPLHHIQHASGTMGSSKKVMKYKSRKK